MAHDDDSAWKDILDTCFEAFLELFFPAIHRDVDWSKGYETLDTQLATILRRARTRKRLADKLVRVTLKGGEAAIILIHVEVQGDPKAGFPLRLFQCNYRIFDRRQEEVISLVVLTDSSPGFRPDCFELKRWGFELRMRFPVVKLLDFDSRRDELEASSNPFALVVLAHLEARRTRKEPQSAYQAKWRLTRMLYERGYERENIAHLFRFIDWVLRLPDELEDELEDRLRTLEGEKPMPYLSRMERRAMERGREEGKAEGKQEGKQEGKEEGLQEGVREGLLEAVAVLLRQRFGDAGLALLPRFGLVREVSHLRSCLEAVAAAGSPEELGSLLPSP